MVPAVEKAVCRKLQPELGKVRLIEFFARLGYCFGRNGHLRLVKIKAANALNWEKPNHAVDSTRFRRSMFELRNQFLRQRKTLTVGPPHQLNLRAPIAKA
jgi:hypothetical protein